MSGIGATLGGASLVGRRERNRFHPSACSADASPSPAYPFQSLDTLRGNFLIAYQAWQRGLVAFRQRAMPVRLDLPTFASDQCKQPHKKENSDPR